MYPIINFAPIVFSLVTSVGILVHDMHIDRATTVALALPVLAATTAAVHISSSDHTHVERASLPRNMTPLRSTLPKMQPPRDDHRQYILNKKVFLSGGDQNYLWPSV